VDVIFVVAMAVTLRIEEREGIDKLAVLILKLHIILCNLSKFYKLKETRWK
jgi:hypothetical protein